jgi:hypothetical protein
MSRTSLVVTAAVAALVATGAASGVCLASPRQETSPAVSRTHPSAFHFTHGRVDNSWFPLRPGNHLLYRGTEGGNQLRDTFFVTYEKKVVDGVTCRVVHDRVFQNGILRERTIDWYAQTQRGTVWYFGEHTALLDRRGHVVSREGSFKSGRHGAEAGIFMPAHPKVGQSFKQENSPGQAEDRFTIRKLTAHISVPVIASKHAMLTKETTRLEPGVLDHKYYVRDLGTVREVTVRGGTESLRLVSVRHVGR